MEAARELKKAYPSARFQLLGGYENRPGSISAAEVSVWVGEGVIEYLGEIDDVRPFLEACHVYVLPSYREGTPRTVLEAMAVGRPIITTDTSGCRQTVRHGENGLLVPVKDSEGAERGDGDDLAVAAPDPDHEPKESRAVSEKYDVHKVNLQMFQAMELI